MITMTGEERKSDKNLVKVVAHEKKIFLVVILDKE